MRTYTQLQAIFGQYLQDHRFTDQPINLYDPVNYILALGGKRVRPLMLLMSHQLFTDDPTPALPAAYAVELFHNFSLLHDDIMDEAPLRRGQPTVHAKYGQNAGILSGDVMLILAYQYLLRSANADNSYRLVDLFSKMAVEVCEGQQLDMDFETRTAVQIDEYLHMITQKTAVLISAGIEMGALIAGASPDDQQRLAAFGLNIGIAFQLQDDILDTFGDPEKFGKKVGGDIAQNKKTYLLLKAFEEADEATEARMRQLMTIRTQDGSAEEADKIRQVKALYEELGVRRQAEDLMNSYQERAFDSLRATGLPEERLAVIAGVASRLLGREN
ncbi:MAG: polyprenyl synthetase family protein [Bacteroidota bacterium]